MSGSAPKKVGFIGLGIMGKPMVRNLVKAGYQVVVHNRSRAAVDQMVAESDAVTAADSPRAVAEQVDTVIIMVPDSPDVRAVVFGAGRGDLRGAAGIPADRHEHDRASDLDRSQRGGRQGRRCGTGRAGQRRRQGRDRRHAQHHGWRRRGGCERGRCRYSRRWARRSSISGSRRGPDRKGVQPDRGRDQLRGGQRGAVAGASTPESTRRRWRRCSAAAWRPAGCSKCAARP